MNNFFLNVSRNIANNNIHALEGNEFVYVTDDNCSYLARISDILNDKIIVSTIPSPRKEVPLENKVIKPFHIGDMTSISHVEELETKYVARQVYDCTPKKVSGHGKVMEFFYDANDSYLFEITRKLDLLDFFDNPEKGLSRIDAFFKTPKLNTIDTVSIGEFLKSKQAFCRHKCGLLYLIGKYIDLDVTMQISDLDDEQERHSFLTYTINQEEIFLDPTLHLVGRKSWFFEELVKNGKTTFYHEKCEPLRVELHF